MLIIPKKTWYGYKNLVNKKIKILNIIDNKYKKRNFKKRNT